MKPKWSGIVALSLLFCLQAYAQIPRTITYQGVLTDTVGTPKPEGTYEFKFRLYESPTGGSSIWEEAKQLCLRHGLFSTALGDQTAFGAALKFDRQYWLGVSIGDEEEMSPRLLLTAAAYSLNSASADTARYALSAPTAGVIDSARIAGTVADSCITGAKLNLPLTLERSQSGVLTVWCRDNNPSGAASAMSVRCENTDFTDKGIGLSAYVTSGYAIRASTLHGAAFYGSNISGTYARVGGSDAAFIGYSGTGNHVARFLGTIEVTGTLTKGGGSFKIDHPLDPENKYLYHSFVESPDMKNVYDGVVVLDASGGANVQLPGYFEALNGDYRYQLTCIGGYAPVFVAKEIAGNQFRIGGGTPGLKVSWQVTGIRRDPFAKANRIVPEVDKPAGERGTYFHAKEYGMSPERGSQYNEIQNGVEMSK